MARCGPAVAHGSAPTAQVARWTCARWVAVRSPRRGSVTYGTAAASDADHGPVRLVHRVHLQLVGQPGEHSLSSDLNPALRDVHAHHTAADSASRDANAHEHAGDDCRIDRRVLRPSHSPAPPRVVRRSAGFVPRGDGSRLVHGCGSEGGSGVSPNALSSGVEGLRSARQENCSSLLSPQPDLGSPVARVIGWSVRTR